MTQQTDPAAVIAGTLPTQVAWLRENRGDIEALITERLGSPESLWAHRALCYLDSIDYLIARDEAGDVPQPPDLTRFGDDIIAATDALGTYIERLLEHHYPEASVTAISVPVPPRTPFKPDLPQSITGFFQEGEPALTKFADDDSYGDFEIDMDRFEELGNAIVEQAGEEGDEVFAELFDAVILEAREIKLREHAHDSRSDDGMLAAYLSDLVDMTTAVFTRRKGRDLWGPVAKNTWHGLIDIMVQSEMDGVASVGLRLRDIAAKHHGQKASESPADEPEAAEEPEAAPEAPTAPEDVPEVKIEDLAGQQIVDAEDIPTR